MPSGLHPDAFAKRGNPGISVKTSIHVPEKKNTSKKTAAWNLIRFQHPNQQIFKKPYSYLSKLTARPKKYYSKALLWLRSLHKKTCWMVQKYPILKTPVFPWRIISPHELHPGFHRSQQVLWWSWRFLNRPISGHSMPPNRDLLSGTWPSMFGVQARWAWRTLTREWKWCILPTWMVELFWPNEIILFHHPRFPWNKGDFPFLNNHFSRFWEIGRVLRSL